MHPLTLDIEAMEKPAALERKHQGRPAGGEVRLPVAEDVRPRDIAAEAVGLTRSTYVNIKTAITTAENEDESEEVREVARDVLAMIDAGEPIRPNVERIKETRRKTESVTTEIIPRRANDNTEYLHLLADKHPAGGASTSG